MNNQAFLKTFNDVSQSIEFNPAWKNGTGYFDNVVQGEHMPEIPTGLTVKCVDDTGRKMLITSVTGHAEDGVMNGKQVSCVVIFERYAPESNRTALVANASNKVKKEYDFLACGGISCEDFRKFHFR
jgi:hypothetical protein